MQLKTGMKSKLEGDRSVMNSSSSTVVRWQTGNSHDCFPVVKPCR